MSDANCQIGDYGIALIKNGTRLSLAGAKLREVEWSRALDAVSHARVEVVTAGDDCCGQIGAVDHWNTDLVVYTQNPLTNRDEVMWRGPVQDARFRRGSVTIEALDTLAWLQVRVAEFDRTFDDDVVAIFRDLANYALTKDPRNLPPYSILEYASGVIESRRIQDRQKRQAWNIVQEMLNAGLDVTTFGTTIIAGSPAFDTLELRDTDVIGEAEVAKTGGDFRNRVIANASQDIFGIVPDGPAQGSNGYPLVEHVLDDTQLQDQASANAAAQAAHDFSAKGVRRVRATGGLVLLPSSKIDPKKLIAGQLFNFTATETCYAARETLRLGKLTVNVTKGQQRATIDLQPVGSLQGGSTL